MLPQRLERSLIVAHLFAEPFTALHAALVMDFITNPFRQSRHDIPGARNPSNTIPATSHDCFDTPPGKKFPAIGMDLESMRGTGE
jgi:hypothetical protein